MDLNIVAILIFIVIAIFFPVSLILTSMALRRRTIRNAVVDSPYESAERSTGNNMTIMNEYVHYFPMFIAYEVIVAVVIVWAPVARTIPFNFNIAILGLLVFGMLFEAAVMLIARKRN